MDTIDRILELLAKKGVTGAEMSRACGFSNAVFSQWKSRKQNPSATKISKMAEYFGVSLEYLMTGEEKEKPAAKSDGLTEKDERDIGKKIEDILGLLKHGDGLTFDGDPLSEDALESIKAAMELGMRTAKLEAKAKYTPKKYRKED